MAQYWMPRYRSVFPDLYADYIGWGEPFCFRCSWLAPVDDTQGSLAAVWGSAAGWLERAHLYDWALGGSNEPENLVPLCRQCHDIMPSFSCRHEAIAYVRDGVRKNGWWQMYTDGAFGASAEFPNPSSKVKLLRDAYVRFVELERLVAAATKGDEEAVARVRSLIGDASWSLHRAEQAPPPGPNPDALATP
ncbi:HNH endonuclease [Micromonospora echinofusca]|uniref:HNH endonuclease n=1 Tax=Micromonospora echinofusca TaxID=47858 RepID=UPI0033D6E892